MIHPATAFMIREKLSTQVIDLHNWSAASKTCRRKNVGSALVHVYPDGMVGLICRAYNGGPDCTGEVGNCGCAHSEPRTIIKALRMGQQVHTNADGAKALLLCTYSPCTNCANIIIDSDLVYSVVFDILTEHDVRGYDKLRDQLPGKIYSIKELTDENVQAWFGIDA